jgi:hypothetical protein
MVKLIIKKMKRLSPLSNDPTYIDQYITIRNKKHLDVRNQLISEHALVKERFDKFEEFISDDMLDFIEIDPRTQVFKNSLRACYDKTTKPLRELKIAIKAVKPPRSLMYCPMCGTTIHSTFDHYLPASLFPEFSVHVLNLVPCCSKCNSIKDNYWINTATGARLFLHAYSDEIPDVIFLEVELHEVPSLAGVGATFKLVIPDEMDEYNSRLIRSHFNRLHLLDRYRELSNDEIGEILANCKIFLDSGGIDVKSFLRGHGKDQSDLYGRNNWRSLLMIALANHHKIEDWVNI